MKPRIGVVDIETFPIAAYTWSLFKPIIGINQIITPGRVAGVGWQWYGEKRVQWISEFDLGREEMVKRVHALLDEANVIVHWNGTSFDEPHLQAEFVTEKLAPPSPTQQVDLMRVVKKRFRLPSYKLDFVAQHLGVGAKMSHSGFSLWTGCMDGDPAAWRKMGAYCKQDVRVTTALYDRLRPYIPTHPHMGLFSSDNCCARCGSTELERRGYAYTNLAAFQQYRCKDCGSWSRSGKSIERVDARGTA